MTTFKNILKSTLIGSIIVMSLFTFVMIIDWIVTLPIQNQYTIGLLFLIACVSGLVYLVLYAFEDEDHYFDNITYVDESEDELLP
jgi:hypothetical protein